MNWQTVKSSNIDAISYDPITKVLSVRFHGSGVYRYSDVPEDLVDQMLEVPSAGSFFSQNIKGKFQVEKERKYCQKCQGEMKLVRSVIVDQQVWECTTPGCKFHEPV